MALTGGYIPMGAVGGLIQAGNVGGASEPPAETPYQNPYSRPLQDERWRRWFDMVQAAGADKFGKQMPESQMSSPAIQGLQSASPATPEEQQYFNQYPSETKAYKSKYMSTAPNYNQVVQSGH